MSRPMPCFGISAPRFLRWEIFLLRRNMMSHKSIDKDVTPGNAKGRASLARFLLPVALLAGAFLPVQADEPAPNEHTARHEVDFMQHTIDHHLQGIRMSEVCMQRATSPELIELCTTMVTSHRAEIDQLQSWLQGWYGETHDPHLAEPQHALIEHLETLSNGEFERSYLKQMIPHHMVGIKEAAKCAVQFHHGELLDMCATAIAVQAEEIRSMRTMLCESYGICSLELRANPITDSLMDDGGEGETPDDDMEDGMDDGGM